MKKILTTILMVLIIFMSIFIEKASAASLDSITAEVTKTTINPGDTVTLKIEFGKELGAYTFDIAYDNKLLEYVSCEGGTANDNQTKVRVTFYDSTGGTSPRSNMNITFKAKQGIITSNPTDLSITAEGLVNNDASEEYDDIVVPIVKNIVVEPKYENYNIDLSYEGEVVENKEKEMILKISSSMGKNYEHARIVAEATTPDGGIVMLKGTDEKGIEQDIIQSGWGEPEGYEIGGQNIQKILNLTGFFTKSGAYTIKIKLIDRDVSDAEIASKTFSITATSGEVSTKPEEENNNETINNGNTNTENNMQNNNPEKETQKEELPQTLPKTGRNVYISIIILAIALITTMVVMQKKNKF